MNLNKKFHILYGLIILGVLFCIFYPRLSSPPISDYWEMFYSFHQLDGATSFEKIAHVVNHDPLERMRYQPLSHVFYYCLHLVFGSNFMVFNIANFLLYFVSILLLYKFSLYFVKNKILTAVFVGFFAFLFSHFDIALWSCHIYVIFGLIMFLLGFMSYIRFLRMSKPYLLFFVTICFLSGMWCYESFFLWPLAILILSKIKSLRNKIEIAKKKLFLANWLILGGVYSVYCLFYLFTRSVGTYETATYKASDFLKLPNFIISGLSVLFNTLYNTIAVNIYPLLAFPLNIRENIYMSGPVINYIGSNPKVILIEGILIAVALFWFFFSLYRKKYFEEIKIMGLFLFLMLSELYVIFFCRIVSNSPVYCFTEFRYQYIPNVFFILLVIYTISRFFKPNKFKQIIIYSILIPSFILNIYCVQKISSLYNNHLANLGKMISSIRLSISRGLINEDDKLYIDKDMPDYFHGLCWNIEMGERFIEKGNYQWMFSKKEIKYFSEDINGADWIIDKEKFNVVEKTAENIRKKGTKVILGKIVQYKELGFSYIEENNRKEAERIFRKAIEIDPGNEDILEILEKNFEDIR